MTIDAKDRRKIAGELRSLVKRYDAEASAVIAAHDVIPFRTVRWLKRQSRALREVIVLMDAGQQNAEYALSFLAAGQDQLDWYHLSPKSEGLVTL